MAANLLEKVKLGAIPSANATTFTLWAPTAKTVQLQFFCKDHENICLSVDKKTGDYFSISVADAKPGCLYKYHIDGKGPFPDPVSRFQPQGVHGPSQVIDCTKYHWTDAGFKGIQDMCSTVIYELHVGTFTPEGTFQAAKQKLDYLVDLGITTIELMPLADFPGRWNWGYDGVSLYAPARCYGTPDDLRSLVDCAHSKGLNVILDVVYNHLGPDGNYLGCFSPFYFTTRHTTPWGAALNVDLTPSSERPEDSKHAVEVRRFLLENICHWAQEYHFDGFRLDATHTIVDDSSPHILQEIVRMAKDCIRDQIWNQGKKDLVFFAEDERNTTKLLLKPPQGYGLNSVWADDFHHQVRVMLAGDHEGYFADFSGSIPDLVTTIYKGWFYSGQPTKISNHPRGEDPTILSDLTAFTQCIQNHDQVGNRAFGERLHHQIGLSAYKAASALLLLTPSVPFLFMGQEWATASRFMFFTDHNSDLGKLVTQGRRNEFKNFKAFSDPQLVQTIPDPQADTTYEKSKIEWDETDRQPHKAILSLYKSILKLRKEVPLFRQTRREQIEVWAVNENTLALVRGAKEHGALLSVICMKGSSAVTISEIASALLAQVDRQKPKLLLNTESEEYQTEGSRSCIRVDKDTIHFENPGAVVLQYNL